MERRFGRRSFAPINVGDELDVKIEAVGSKGDGVARVKGFVIFVPGTKQGDEVKIKVNKVLNKVSFAEVITQNSSQETSEEQYETQEEV